MAELGGDMRALWQSMWRPFPVFDGSVGVAAVAEGGSVAEGEEGSRPERADLRGDPAPEAVYGGVLQDLARLLALHGEGRGWQGASRASGAPLPSAFLARSVLFGVTGHYADYVRLREEASRKELRRRLLERLLADAPEEEAPDATAGSSGRTEEVEKRRSIEGALIRVVLSHDGDDADPIKHLTFSRDDDGDFVPKAKWVDPKAKPSLTGIAREVEAVLGYEPKKAGGSVSRYLRRQTGRGSSLGLEGEFTPDLGVWIPKVNEIARRWGEAGRLHTE
jgi:hypothetical protein